MENQTNNPLSKSTFVTVFAWFMIVINGFGLFVVLMQNIMLLLFSKVDQLNSVFNDIGDMPKGFPTFIFKNLKWIVPLLGLIVLFAFISSVGLLKRKEWARKGFLFLLGFGIVYIIACSIMQIAFIRLMFSSSDIPSEFDPFSVFFIAFMVIFSLGIIFLFGWLFKKLSSSKIKEEFNPPLTDIL